jgi:hypothetical protein
MQGFFMRHSGEPSASGTNRWTVTNPRRCQVGDEGSPLRRRGKQTRMESNGGNGA